MTTSTDSFGIISDPCAYEFYFYYSIGSVYSIATFNVLTNSSNRLFDKFQGLYTYIISLASLYFILGLLD